MNEMGDFSDSCTILGFTPLHQGVLARCLCSHDNGVVCLFNHTLAISNVDLHEHLPAHGFRGSSRLLSIGLNHHPAQSKDIRGYGLVDYSSVSSYAVEIALMRPPKDSSSICVTYRLTSSTSPDITMLQLSPINNAGGSLLHLFHLWYTLWNSQRIFDVG